MKLPHLKLYTDDLPEGVGGTTAYFVVRIRPKYRDDTGIRMHEYTHVGQWYALFALGALAALLMAYAPELAQWREYWIVALLAGVFAHNLLYSLVPKYRLWAEVAAYREQLMHYPDDRAELFAGFIANRYRLDVSKDDALNLLRN